MEQMKYQTLETSNTQQASVVDVENPFSGLQKELERYQNTEKEKNRLKGMIHLEDNMAQITADKSKTPEEKKNAVLSLYKDMIQQYTSSGDTDTAKKLVLLQHKEADSIYDKTFQTNTKAKILTFLDETKYGSKDKRDKGFRNFMETANMSSEEKLKATKWFQNMKYTPQEQEELNRQEAKNMTLEVKNKLENLTGQPKLNKLAELKQEFASTNNMAGTRAINAYIGNDTQAKKDIVDSISGYEAIDKQITNNNTTDGSNILKGISNLKAKYADNKKALKAIGVLETRFKEHSGYQEAVTNESNKNNIKTTRIIDKINSDNFKERTEHFKTMESNAYDSLVSDNTSGQAMYDMITTLEKRYKNDSEIKSILNEFKQDKRYKKYAKIYNLEIDSDVKNIELDKVKKNMGGDYSTLVNLITADDSSPTKIRQIMTRLETKFAGSPKETAILTTLKNTNNYKQYIKSSKLTSRFTKEDTTTKSTDIVDLVKNLKEDNEKQLEKNRDFIEKNKPTKERFKKIISKNMHSVYRGVHGTGNMYKIDTKNKYMLSLLKKSNLIETREGGFNYVLRENKNKLLNWYLKNYKPSFDSSLVKDSEFKNVNKILSKIKNMKISSKDFSFPDSVQDKDSINEQTKRVTDKVVDLLMKTYSFRETNKNKLQNSIKKLFYKNTNLKPDVSESIFNKAVKEVKSFNAIKEISALSPDVVLDKKTHTATMKIPASEKNFENIAKMVAKYMPQLNEKATDTGYFGDTLAEKGKRIWNNMSGDMYKLDKYTTSIKVDEKFMKDLKSAANKTFSSK